MEYALAFTFLTAFDLHNNDPNRLINVPILLISEVPRDRNFIKIMQLVMGEVQFKAQSFLTSKSRYFVICATHVIEPHTAPEIPRSAPSLSVITAYCQWVSNLCPSLTYFLNTNNSLH